MLGGGTTTKKHRRVSSHRLHFQEEAVFGDPSRCAWGRVSRYRLFLVVIVVFVVIVVIVVVVVVIIVIFTVVIPAVIVSSISIIINRALPEDTLGSLHRQIITSCFNKEHSKHTGQQLYTYTQLDTLTLKYKKYVKNKITPLEASTPVLDFGIRLLFHIISCCIVCYVYVCVYIYIYIYIYICICACTHTYCEFIHIVYQD